MVKHVLYVDDDEDDRMIFSEAFNHEGYEVITLESGKQLFRLLQDPGPVNPCLLIMDINMPQQTGIEVLRLLKSESKYAFLPVVMFSTSVNHLECKECDDYGVDIIVKPGSFDELRETQKLLLKYCEGFQGH
jgi:CheY-like chemotaxis protein